MSTSSSKKLKRVLEDYLDGVPIHSSSLLNIGALSSAALNSLPHNIPSPNGAITHATTSPTSDPIAGPASFALEDPLTAITPFDAYISLMNYFPEVYRRRKEAHSMVSHKPWFVTLLPTYTYNNIFIGYFNSATSITFEETSC